jgi:hypothetical protein
MTNSNFDQLKKIKALYENGGLTEAEYNEMKNNLINDSVQNEKETTPPIPEPPKSFFAANKGILLLIALLFGGGIAAFFMLQKEPEKDAKLLAKKLIEIESEKQLSINQSLLTLLQAVESKTFEFKDEVDLKITEITQTASNSMNYKSKLRAFELEKTKQLKNYREKDAALFTKTLEATFMSDFDLSRLIDEQDKLLKDIERVAQEIGLTNSEEFSVTKSNVSTFIHSFYSEYESQSFDAYNWFSYTVERFLTSKNVTPTQINIFQKKSTSDYTEKYVRLIDETLELVEKTDAVETWKYSTEFRAYRPSKQFYQVCNVWYEMKINAAQKIVSYKELKTENKKYMSADEYTTIYSSSSPTSDDQYDSPESEY